MSNDFLSYFTKEEMKKTKGGKFARKVVRNRLKKEHAKMSNTGSSEIAEMKLASRRERRAEARSKERFEPVYNGDSPVRVQHKEKKKKKGTA